MKKFTDAEIAYLRGLKAVDNVTTNRIIYSEEFKRHFLREYWNGRKPTEIFRDAGLPVILLGCKRIERRTRYHACADGDSKFAWGFGHCIESSGTDNPHVGERERNEREKHEETVGRNEFESREDADEQRDE